MQKADEKAIGWCDFTSNPIRCKCRHNCSYCYMKRYYRMRPELYPVEPRLDEKEMDQVFGRRRPPSRIWFGSSTDMFGDWVPDEMISDLIEELWYYPDHIFLFLTKKPRRYASFDWPDNCWLGVTLEGAHTYERARQFRRAVPRLGRRFVSCEPLLGEPYGTIQAAEPSWVIVGADSRRGARIPERKWADRAAQYADEWHVPLFIKSNLAKHFPDAEWAGRREMP